MVSNPGLIQRMLTIVVEVKKTTNDYVSLLFDFRLTRFLLPSSIVSCFQGTESHLAYGWRAGNLN